MKNAYFAGGCFWCIAPVFRNQKGVFKVISGYSGGSEIEPSYEQVKSGLTHHRETISILYDEQLIAFEDLVQIFLWNVDPYDPEGQFIDKGHSYTLAIYYNDDNEKMISENKVSQLEKSSGKHAFISLEPFKVFYAAEEFHQNFDIKNPDLFQKELQESGRIRYFDFKK